MKPKSLRKKGNDKAVQAPPPSSPPVDRADNRFVFLSLAFIALATVVVYAPLRSAGFINWDDHGYLAENPWLQSFDVVEMFSNYWMANYHPLTMLGYSLQYPFFGMEPLGYHFVNVLLHIANSMFVFYFVYRLLNRQLVPAVVAALLFAIHPMHVESVAWVSELKDVLHTLFFLTSLLAYLHYLEKKLERKFLLIALGLFGLSLLSKAQAVTLPVLLLLIDYLRQRKLNKAAGKSAIFCLSVGVWHRGARCSRVEGSHKRCAGS